MARSRVVRGIAAACALMALLRGDAAAQDTTRAPTPVVPLGTPAPARSEQGAARRLRQYREFNRFALDRLERALLTTADDQASQRAYLLEAEGYGRAALELVPDSAQAYFVIAAALGMRGDHEPVRQRIRMAGEVHVAALAALEREPDHAGAHHVLGRLHFEVMRVSGMTRLIATHVFGSSLIRQASWQQAEAHLRRAAEIEPRMLGHRLWLGRLYAARRQEAAARRELQAVLDATPLSDLDRLWQREAAEAITALRP